MAKFKLKKDYSSFKDYLKIGAIVEGTPSGDKLIITKPDNRTMSLLDFEKVDDSSQGSIPNAQNSTTIEPPKEIVDVFSKLQAVSKRAKILSPIGLIGGLAFAHYKKSGVGGYIGYALLFSFVGTLVAVASVKISPPKNK